MRFASPLPALAPQPARTPTITERLRAALGSGPFHHALALAIAARGLTLEQLRNRLSTRDVQLSAATLSYWKNGRSVPRREESLRGISVLEQELDLPKDALTSLLDRRGPRVGLPPQPPGRIESLLDWQRLPVGSGLRVLSLHETLHLGADGLPERLTLHEVVQATRDGVVRTHAGLRAGQSELAPRITATVNCSVGRVQTRHDDALAVVELVLDSELARGETAVLGHEFTFSAPRRENYHQRHFRQPVHSYLLEVHFAARAVPVQCWSYQRDLISRRQHRVRPVRPDSRPAVHVAHTNLAPGTVGLRWQWS
ncbi:hypothetical protein GCM10010174_57900 [Kutzneria viridogrisea]|uniref:Uncharacterized protein n=2 Tax=Kutzneria TaxID=43356 RepID=W5W3C1_9PSEU|nr:hypothetical protein [Kutzneria albida]AHH95280.1 hypothetical protein KALB_1910 [Kutzneria albida DSM 43870]MBA8927364.1 transcriptional regulator with XRE-family HTH domain [Kutzneria viridogrisea]